MRSVTHMTTTSLDTEFSSTRKLLRVSLESLAGILAVFVILTNSTWQFGTVQLLLNWAIGISLGVAVGMHRIRPVYAASALIAGTFFAFVALWLLRDNPHPATVLVGAFVLLGLTAYGPSWFRWVALALSSLGAAAASQFVVGAEPRIYGEVIRVDVASWVLVLATWLAAMIPWILGELVRSILKRRALSATVTAVSTERDAALTRADLEAERTRVARDVHDIVAHSLTVVIAQADGARYATTADSPAAADAFGTIAQTARDALADVRTLLTELRHTQEAGRQPGIQNLDALVDSFRDSGLTLTVHEFGDRGGLTDARELALYRILQESLTNALRHGDGAATLDLDWGDDTVDLLVTNVAAAPAPASADAAATVVTHGDHQPERGHGIDGMRERAILAGGEFSIREGATFRVRARLPREPREHSQPEPATPDTIDTEVLA